MLGSNQKVRKTPVTRRTTKLHSAISPSMNDQWSGNTFRNDMSFGNLARPRRSSAQLAARPARLGLRATAASALRRATFEMSISMGQRLLAGSIVSSSFRLALTCSLRLGFLNRQR